MRHLRLAFAGVVLILALVIPVLVSGAADPAATARQYVQCLIAGDYEAAQNMQDQAMSAQANAAFLKMAWESLQKQMGSFKEMSTPVTESKNGLNLVYVPCRFDAATIDILVVVNAGGQVTGLRFTPHINRAVWETPPYADPSEFTEVEMAFGDTAYPLKGTLTIPAGMKTYPVVVLVHGSGPNDRDETLGPNKMFKDIAWALASRGIAVFRYDKRTAVYGEKMDPYTLTVKEEVINDAVAALNTVRHLKNVRGAYLLGHSLGGMLAPDIAREVPSLRGVIVMAGSPRPVNEVLRDQLLYLANHDGVITPAERANLDQFEAANARLKNGTLGPKEFIMNMPACYLYDFLGRDPIAVAKKLRKPMLFLQGERDYQITLKDLQLYRDALRGRRYTYKTYPTLGHTFIEIDPHPNAEYVNKQGHVDLQVIDDIVAWMGKNK